MRAPSQNPEVSPRSGPLPLSTRARASDKFGSGDFGALCGPALLPTHQIPTLHGFSQIDFVPTRGPAQLHRDPASNIKVIVGMCECELVNAEPGIGSAGVGNLYRLTQGSIFAQEESAGALAVASTRGDVRIRAASRTITSGDSKHSVLSLTHGADAVEYVHSSTITGLSLTGHETQVLFGDAVGRLFTGCLKRSEGAPRFVVCQIAGAQTGAAAAIVGISALNEQIAALTANGLVIERMKDSRTSATLVGSSIGVTARKQRPDTTSPVSAKTRVIIHPLLVDGGALNSEGAPAMQSVVHDIVYVTEHTLSISMTLSGSDKAARTANPSDSRSGSIHGIAVYRRSNPIK